MTQHKRDTIMYRSGNLRATFYKYMAALDRVPKKSKFAEWPAEFSVYSRDKYKNFLLTKF